MEALLQVSSKAVNDFDSALKKEMFAAIAALLRPQEICHDGKTGNRV